MSDPGADPAERLAAVTPTDSAAVRVRGIYATALTRLLVDAGHDVVAATPPIERRFDREFPAAGRDVAVDMTDDRRGLGVVGDASAVAAVRDLVADLALDVLVRPDPLAPGTVVDGVVRETLGSGAVVDCGDREGFLAYDDADADLEEGDVVRVQVRSSAPPWADRRPELATDLEATAGPATLVRGGDGVSVAGGREDDARELAGMTDLLDVDLPGGWGVRWDAAATDADLEALASSLAAAGESATTLADAVDVAGDPTPDAAPRTLAATSAAAWVWLGREGRFALDEHRRAVTSTMPGHHRTKAATEAASAGVDFVEALCALADVDEFPFETVTDQFGPTEGDRVAIGHGKPEGHLITLGRGTVQDVAADGTVTVERQLSSRGRYDGLGTEREPGDVATTKFREGRWWYPTTYRGEDGASKGTYVNVCTPVEVFPEVVRYVDLEVDVVRDPDGGVDVVDEDVLAAAVDGDVVPEPLAAKARSVARSVASALRE